MVHPNPELDTDDYCPTCIEPFDDQDRLFLPCACQYRVCMFCVRRIMTEFDGRCPGCRSAYQEENFRFKQLDPEEVARHRRQKAEKARQAERERARVVSQQLKAVASSAQKRPGAAGGKKSPLAAPYSGPPPAPLLDLARTQRHESEMLSSATRAEEALVLQRKHLANVRVLLRHIVFVTGLPPSLCREDVLRRKMAGFGQVVRVLYSRPSRNVVSCHVSFARIEDARTALQGLEGLVVDTQTLHCALGTAKYCPAFLRGQSCQAPECPHLHVQMDDALVVVAKERAFLDAEEDVLSPEHLGGVDLQVFERSRPGGVPIRMTTAKAPGEGVVRSQQPDLPGQFSGPNCSPISLTAALILRRSHAIHPDVKTSLGMLCAPRPNSLVRSPALVLLANGPQAFSGLGALLTSSGPLFLAPAESVPDGSQPSASSTPSAEPGEDAVHAKTASARKRGSKSAAAAAARTNGTLLSQE